MSSERKRKHSNFVKTHKNSDKGFIPFTDDKKCELDKASYFSFSIHSTRRSSLLLNVKFTTRIWKFHRIIFISSRRALSSEVARVEGVDEGDLKFRVSSSFAFASHGAINLNSMSDSSENSLR